MAYDNADYANSDNVTYVDGDNAVYHESNRLVIVNGQIYEAWNTTQSVIVGGTIFEEYAQDAGAPTPLSQTRVSSMHFLKMYQPTPMAYS